MTAPRALTPEEKAGVKKKHGRPAGLGYRPRSPNATHVVAAMSLEQRNAIAVDILAEIPVNEICRKHAISRYTLDRLRQAAWKELKENGPVVGVTRAEPTPEYLENLEREVKEADSLGLRAICLKMAREFFKEFLINRNNPGFKFKNPESMATAISRLADVAGKLTDDDTLIQQIVQFQITGVPRDMLPGVAVAQIPDVLDTSVVEQEPTPVVSP